MWFKKKFIENIRGSSHVENKSRKLVKINFADLLPEDVKIDEYALVSSHNMNLFNLILGEKYL